jgi:arsenical pump membrane protein
VAGRLALQPAALRPGPRLNGAGAEAVSAILLLAVLAFAVIRPRGWPEVVVAVPAAGLLVALGAVGPAAAGTEVRRLLPVVGFLAAVLVLAQLCDREGLFAAAGAAMAAVSRGQPGRLLVAVFVIASVTTAVLSLDATVVLLTPVVLATTARARLRPKPHVYACTHLANSASLLLPVANLTNLLALAASGLSFLRFAALMAAPWLAAIGVEYVVFRRFFAADLTAADLTAAAPAAAAPATAVPATAVPAAAGPPPPAGRPGVPVFGLAVLGLTLAGFVLTSLGGVSPAWAALAGAAVLGGRSLARRRIGLLALAGAASPLFLLFVLALGVVVRGVVDNGLGSAADRLLPDGTSLPALAGVAVAAAVLANLINNLPAVLALLPVAALGGPGPVLATLIGVNVGPNLTYAGSLATLLWRRVLREHDAEPAAGEFLRLGLAAVPVTLAAAVVALWAMLRILGG